MSSRFAYYLLASLLFHALVLGFPFSVRTSGHGGRARVPVRVHLLAVGDTAANQSQGIERSEANAPFAPGDDLEAKPVPSRAKTNTPPAGIALEAARKYRAQEAAVEREPATKKKRQKEEQPRRRIANTGRAAKRVTRRRKSLRTTTVVQASAPTPAKTAASAVTDAGAFQQNRLAASAATADASHRAAPASFSQVRYARIVKPRYPEQARTQGWEGTTVLKVLVDQAGNSEEVRVQRTSGFNVLDDAAVNAMRRWEFHPARQGQRAVQSWVRIPIVFKLKEAN